MSAKINKRAIFEALIRSLEKNLESLKQSSHSALEAATHEESKAEDQYDTRGLEASYLAGAQAQRVSNLEKMLFDLQQFSLPALQPTDKIVLGALVQLMGEDHSLNLFLLPFGGGTSVEWEQKTIAVISPASPMGTELMGKKAGAIVSVKTKGQSKEFEIESVL